MLVLRMFLGPNRPEDIRDVSVMLLAKNISCETLVTYIGSN